jgi:hypothetical protein
MRAAVCAVVDGESIEDVPTGGWYYNLVEQEAFARAPPV